MWLKKNNLVLRLISNSSIDRYRNWFKEKGLPHTTVSSISMAEFFFKVSGMT
ncbi:MAG: hypothetical protein CM15mP87_04730 [Candidatus Neomarinimicrobiota bacterium]|nr:MAG: hypothetical protein CM15mP87_04730 [Candidatus Neomarinimicrobiota bacterium]